MADTRGRVLIVEDEEYYTRAYLPRLARQGYETECAVAVDEALAKLGDFAPDVVILDLMLQRQEIEEGFAVLRQVSRLCPGAKVIVVTSHGRAAVGERALQLGAYDFIDKEERGYDELTFRVNQAYDRVQLEKRISDRRRADVESVGGFRYGKDGVIVGTSAPMRDLYHEIDRVGPTNAPVLILGESGTGKELVAAALHEQGRAGGRLVPVNCGAIPTELVESELFGYAKGAHSTATQDRAGLFEAAGGGTLFLDEVGDLPLEMQGKLLRAIEQRRIRRVGDDEERPVDARIVAATNRDLERAVADGQFREDLFFRLNTFVLRVPSLRERREDVPLLVEHFIERCGAEHSRHIAGIQEEALALLRDSELAGNVRGLEHAISRAVLFAKGEYLTAAELSIERASPVAAGAAGPAAGLAEQLEATLATAEAPTLPQLMAAVEERLIRGALEASASQQEAARRLGITESGLRKKMDKHGIPRVRAART